MSESFGEALAGIRHERTALTSLQEQVSQLFLEAREDVYRYLLTLGLDPGRAQEAVQEVFLRLYCTMKKGEEIQNPRAWIFRVAHNLGLKLRARQSWEAAFDLNLEAQLSSPAPNAEFTLLERERLLRFAATLIDHAMQRGYRVGLALARDGDVRVLSPSEGRGQRSDLLDELALADDNRHTPLAETLARVPRAQLAKAEAVVCGPAKSLEQAPLRALAARCRHLHVLSAAELPRIFQDNPLEQAPADPGGPAVSAASSY
jgi:hypothetical protein